MIVLSADADLASGAGRQTASFSTGWERDRRFIFAFQPFSRLSAESGNSPQAGRV